MTSYPQEKTYAANLPRPPAVACVCVGDIFGMRLPNMNDKIDISKHLDIKETDFRLIIGRTGIDYDVNKEKTNRKKHGYSLESAVYMLQRWLLPLGGPPPISKGPVAVNGEIRHLHMGIDDKNNVVFIVTTMRPDETVRVISFRNASHEERKIYHQMTGGAWQSGYLR